MRLLPIGISVLLTRIIATHATPHEVSRFDRLGRQTGAAAEAAPIVDLGYARYQGSHDPIFGLDVYKGYFRISHFLLGKVN